MTPIYYWLIAAVVTVLVAALTYFAVHRAMAKGYDNGVDDTMALVNSPHHHGLKKSGLLLVKWEFLDELAAIEGHPDNAACCTWCGGFLPSTPPNVDDEGMFVDEVTGEKYDSGFPRLALRGHRPDCVWREARHLIGDTEA